MNNAQDEKGHVMSVQLPPTGARGWELAKHARRLTGISAGFSYALYRLLGGRRRVLGLPLLLLTTVGARSGQHRRAMLQCYPDGEEAWLIVASLAGSASHPAWLRNLVEHPDQGRLARDGLSRDKLGAR